MRRRGVSVMTFALVGAVTVAAVGTYATAQNGSKNFRTTRMSGYLEVPSVSSTATGRFEAELKGQALEYRLTYSNLTGTATAAHIHFGQTDVNGGVSAFLCGGGGKAACPPSGTVSGTITAPLVDRTDQGIAPSDFSELLAAMRAGVTYANVHSDKFPGGELRGQIRRGHGGNGDNDD